MANTQLELADEPGGSGGVGGVVPPPLPPDDPEAWYAPDVQAQYEVHPGVVVTITRRETDFAYAVREPVLTAGDTAQLDSVESHFAAAHLERPRTHEGAVETMAAGFSEKPGTGSIPATASESAWGRKRSSTGVPWMLEPRSSGSS